MLNRRFITCLIVVGIIVFLSVCYMGYRAYQKHVEFEEFMLTTAEFERSSDKDTSTSERTEEEISIQSESHTPNPQPVKVRFKTQPLLPRPPNSRITGIVRLTPENMVKRDIQTPDGEIHTIWVHQDAELREGMSLTQEFINSSKRPPMPERKQEITEMVVRKADIPEGEDVETYANKLHIASEYGVSIEEAERMLARGQIRIEVIERTPVEEFTFDEFFQETGLDTAPIPPRRGEVDTGRSSTHSETPPTTPEPNLVNKAHVHHGAEHLHETQNVESQAMQLREQLSPERFDKARQLIDQYGTEEGLRRLRESDPDAARQFERHRPISPRKQGENKEPAREVPDKVESATQ